MTLQERLEKPGPKRILALDGGGIRGALTLGYLEKIEQLLRDRHQNPDLRLCDYFDLIGGTSTGSIIAAGLATGMSASEIKEIYLSLGDKIFGGKYNMIKTFIKGAQFDFVPLEEALKDVFGDITMGDDQAIKTGLCIIAKRADTLSTWPVINHPGGKYFKYNKDILLRQMVRASSAAPTYFIPQQITVAPGQEAAFIDGGISMANNPAFQLFMVATLKGFPFHWNTGGKELFITSIGTGSSEPSYKIEEILDKNLLEWARYMPDAFMADADYLNQTILQYLSDSPAPVYIDSEIEDLSQDLLGGKPSLSYIRYNVTLEQEPLKALGFDFDEKTVTSMQEMSNSENRFELAKIGTSAAQQQVKASHFPSSFDLNAKAETKKRFVKGQNPENLAFREAVKKRIPIRVHQMDEPFEVETLEGTMQGKPGDYLVIGAVDEMYVISKEVFERTYDWLEA
jgi:patatin-like phospholipase/acyl hydrolase